MERNLGDYINQDTGERYSVIERTQEVGFTDLGRSKVTTRHGSVDYFTSCGKELEDLDDDLNSFKLIQEDSIIHKE